MPNLLYRLFVIGTFIAGCAKAQVTVCDFTWGSFFILMTNSNGFFHSDGSTLCSQYIPGANYPFFADIFAAGPISPLVSCIVAGSAVTFPNVGAIFWYNAASQTAEITRCLQVVQNQGLALNDCSQSFGVGGLLCARPTTNFVVLSSTQTQVSTTTRTTTVSTLTVTSTQTIVFLVGSTSTDLTVVGTTTSFTQTRNVLTTATETSTSLTTTSTTTTVVDSEIIFTTSTLFLTETSYVTITQQLTDTIVTTKLTLTTECRSP